MTRQDKLNKMVALAVQLPVEELQKQIKIFADDFSNDSGGYVFNSLLNALEWKMNESDFVAFCETI